MTDTTTSDHSTTGLGYNSQQDREGITTETHDWTMITAGSLIQNQHVVTIEASTPVEDACEILIKNNISSAPVYDVDVSSIPSSPSSPVGAIKKLNYVGMFDYGDLITYLLIVLRKMDVPDGEQTLEIKELVRRALGGQSVPVKLASGAYLSRKNPFYSILPEATLLSVVEEFACGTHRVCVMDANGEIKGILSQSTVVTYLHKNVNKFPQLKLLLEKS
ncbi:hypothetical protein BC938DRAFT_483322, partial [Jimgerdemannia flammicorona]